MPKNLTGKRIVIAGGSGFLGLSLTQYLHKLGATVTILSRSKPVDAKAEHVRWDGRTLGTWAESVSGADAIINLAGRTVNCIKSPDKQDEILRSRIESTLVLGEAVRCVPCPPAVWLQMSTAHIYGDPPHIVCDEDSQFGIGFAPDIGNAWEKAFRDSLLDGQRGVIMRTSFVLGRDRGAGAGALGLLARLARLGLGGRVGAGTQGMSWIHEADLNRIFATALCEESWNGAYVVSAPNPVSQAEFMRTLRAVVRMPIGLPATEWMVRVAAPILFRTDPELALYGRYVISKRLEEAGFEFEFPKLKAAFEDILSK